MQTHNNVIMHNNKKSNITSIINNNNNTKNITRTTSVPLSHPRSHGSTTQACAACKYQRRKCASDCVLAPYFPHDRQRQFLNAHRLFGVSNIVKIVRHLDPPAKDHAMRTIIFQSDARAADPVGGCHRIIRDLEQRISLAKAELEIVLHHLALCRAAATQQQVVPAPDCGGSYDEKWRVPYVAEDEAVTVDDVNSWGCMPGNVHTNAESTSSSFPHHNDNSNHHHMRKLSVEECNNDVLPILDHLTCDDDVREEDFKFDHHGNIVPSNGILTEEKGTFKEDDDCFSYVQDHHDLKAAATFFSLTNCDI
ncbi:LOB domain-containing protein 7-like isoform X2 [Sesamum indicum]|uniref:LOB domain-containing protein 7-like isoform X2 n=1 Tax=Sesamum indicum TaxID=4182 RepID=A0A8M8UP13_SESIN|nr:LOB domain-containing protein 7-like isoform X2 [Sesamum indicum]